MTDFYAKRADWLVKAAKLEPHDVLVIHPLDGLTAEMVVDAMKAQGLIKPPGYVIMHHGTKIMIQRHAKIEYKNFNKLLDMPKPKRRSTKRG